jgi:hypothetical protein
MRASLDPLPSWSGSLGRKRGCGDRKICKKTQPDMGNVSYPRPAERSLVKSQTAPVVSAHRGRAANLCSAGRFARPLAWGQMPGSSRFYFADAIFTCFSSMTFTIWPSRRFCWPGTIAKSAGLTPETISTFVPSLKPTSTGAFFILPSLKM